MIPFSIQTPLMLFLQHAPLIFIVNRVRKVWRNRDCYFFIYYLWMIGCLCHRSHLWSLMQCVCKSWLGMNFWLWISFAVFLTDLTNTNTLCNDFYTIWHRSMFLSQFDSPISFFAGSYYLQVWFFLGVCLNWHVYFFRHVSHNSPISYL